MFNANDSKDKVFDSEKKEVKENTKQPFEFAGFSQNQDEVIIDNTEPISAAKKSHISFKEFEEAPIITEQQKKNGEKNFEEYFEQGRAEQNELEKEETPKKKQKKPKKIRRRKRKEIEDFDDVKKRRAYKYKKKKYTRVVEFIKYLDDNYLDLDEIADKVLSDENFHGWLKKRSKKFDESINEFKDIVETIGN